MKTLHQQRTHPLPVEGCFGCKAASIQWGNANPDAAKASKKWDGELDYYQNLREQGIQPAGTTQAKCEEADRKSQDIQQAFDATDPFKHVDLAQFEED